MNKNTFIKKFLALFSEQRSYLVLIGFSVLAVGITYVLYWHTEDLLKDRLQERLTAIASTAAVQFDAEDIRAVRDQDDLGSLEMERITHQLQAIRDANSDIQFVYLMRRTDDPHTLAFVADADSLTPEEEWDTNEDGVIDEDEEIPLPGDSYPIDEYPVLHDEAFFHPAVDRELQPDQWGLIMAAYAPILDEEREAVAIVGMDVLVNDFRARTQAMLLPFALFVLFLISALTLMTLLLVRIWRERVEAMKALDKQKDELMSIVNHQLAAPIAALRWNTELFLEGDVGELKPDQKDQLKMMYAIVMNLADLVETFLDVSRLQLGRMKVSHAPIELSSFFEEILSIIHPRIQEKKITLVKNFPSVWPEAVMDRRLTRMAIENMLTNAAKYTPEKGTVHITVKVENGKLLCEVRDTGCGIPKEEQGRVFERLFRASNARDGFEGNGLGLYAAKSGIESQSGKMWFASEEGKGSTFSVELPLKPCG